jgi:hypothetical protein
LQNHLGQNNIVKVHTPYLEMKIINKKEEINFSKWMEKVKDSYGLIRWGYKCVQS